MFACCSLLVDSTPVLFLLVGAPQYFRGQIAARRRSRAGYLIVVSSVQLPGEGRDMLASLVYLVIWLVIIGLVFWLLTWALGQLPIPEPIRTVIRVILVVVVVLICLYVLLGFLPSMGLRFPPSPR